MANKGEDAMLRKKYFFHGLIGYQIVNTFVLNFTVSYFVIFKILVSGYKTSY